MRWLWPLINIVQGVSLAFMTSVSIIIGMALSPVIGFEFLLGACRWYWAPMLLGGSGARLSVTGRENVPDRSAFFVANHQSQLDIPVLFRVVPVNIRFIVKAEHRRIPFLGFFIGASGMVYIDRRARLRAVETVRKVADLLDTGHSIAAFPEGTRSRDGKLRPFKTGVLVPAIEAGAPVVPIAIVGAERVLPADGFRVRPGTVHVRIGEPIETHELTTDDRRWLAVEARRRVQALRDSILDGEQEIVHQIASDTG
ncbi:MAG: lysophospholipid acyltransferase family protein [Acidobacteriota bacterium]